jgi:hypothetical protein
MNDHKIQRLYDVAKLERALIDAYYLGLALRALGRRSDFAAAGDARATADHLIDWARRTAGRMRSGEALFPIED